MPNHQTLCAIQFFLIVLTILIIQKQQQAAHFHHISNQNRCKEEEAIYELELIAASLEHPHTRQCWVEARNSAWIDGVLDGSLLQGKRLEKIFRMTRESFYKLHKFLGTKL